MIEVELRGLLSKQSYNRLLGFLISNASNIEHDDKIVDYYDYVEGILKVVDETSRTQAKISLKVGDEFSGLGMDEYDVHLGSTDDIASCKKILNSLGYKIKSTTLQKRINCTYEDVEFAIKHTRDWGYHFEAEVLVNNRSEVAIANDKIKKVCRNLDITVMNEDELRKFIQNLQTK